LLLDVMLRPCISSLPILYACQVLHIMRRQTSSLLDHPASETKARLQRDSRNWDIYRCRSRRRCRCKSRRCTSSSIDLTPCCFFLPVDLDMLEGLSNLTAPYLFSYLLYSLYSS